MKKFKGVTLVSLIITIIVMIILAGTVIALFKDNGIIDKANESVFKNDITVFQQELKLYLADRQIKLGYSFNKEDIHETTYEGIKTIIQSFTQEYENKVIIYNGELIIDFTNLNDKEKQWAQDIDLNIYASGMSNEIIPSESKLIKNYRIYGNSIQNGTPTPTGCIDVISLGENNKNLFNEDNYKTLSQYTIEDSRPYSYASIQLKPNTTYKMSVTRYNGFSGEGKGYFLISNTTYINGNTWSSIAHNTLPNFSCVNYTYTTDSNGLLYIGYSVTTTTQTILDYIWENTDVQIEEGTTATEYVPYKTEQYINMRTSSNDLIDPSDSFTIDLTGHEPLRKIGDVADYIDYEKGVIVRNIGRYVITGEENNIKVINNCLYITKKDECMHRSYLGFCNMYKNVTNTLNLWNNTQDKICIFGSGYFGDNTASFIAIYDSDYLTAEDWEGHLKNLYANGIPVTVYYQLAIPREESIALPKINDTTKLIEIMGSDISPSRIEVEYLEEVN